MFDELKASISSLRERAEVLGRYLDREAKLARIAEIDLISAEPDFWNDHQRAQSLGREKTRLQKDIDAVDAPLNAIKEAAELLEMAELEGEEEFATEVAASVERIEQEISDLEFARMMSGENDRNDAIVEIHAGMGGTESQDWVQMLLRMYLMWCERRGFKVDVLDELAGEEAGLKSVAFQVSGDWAYGYLKAEGGVHRLVRISPFDANARRHTTFAGVSVLPDIEDTIDIEVKDEDLRVDTYRAGGAGGQHVNKTDSAVRLTHLPTGIVVQCQNERSQLKNRSMAMKMLKARLYDLERKKKEFERDKIEAAKKEIDFGSQIRSYVLHPYRMVKDLRTDYETGNADAVLNGDLDGFIHAYLLMQAAS
ncbi:MAG: peptide chain release factor 2 [Myxococcota bacterium]